MAGHQPNLLPQRKFNRVRILQVAIGATLVVSASMAWSLLWRGPSNTPQTASIGQYADTTTSPSPTTTHQQAPKALSTGTAYSLAVGTDSESVRYFDELGRAFSVNPGNGRITILSDSKVQGFIRGWWLPGSLRAVIQSQKGSGSEFQWHDFQAGLSAVMGTDFMSLTVSRDGRSIAFTAPSDDHMAIFTSGADGSARHPLLQTRISEDSLSWPADERLALVSRRPDQNGWDLSLVGMNGALTPVLTDRENLATQWSRDGSQLLYSAFITTQGIELFLRTITTGEDIPLGIATSADKCAWTPDGTRIVCGVPTHSSLTGDVPASKTATVDTIISFDLTTGAQQTVWTPPSGTLMGVIDPVITSSGRAFAFTNLFDHRLYSVSLDN